MKEPIFVTGIGTGIGKTLVSAIVVETLQADYWKPVQAGIEPETDSDWVRKNVTNINSIVHPECYRLQEAASPHLAARIENSFINVQEICAHIPIYSSNLIVEGAGGLLVPLNETEFIADLILALRSRVVLVSRNYLGSINHSLLTAAECRRRGIPVMGWFFVGYESSYEKEISGWSDLPVIASLPHVADPGKRFIKAMAEFHRESITNLLC